MSEVEPIRAPRGLGSSGSRLWRQIASKYALRPDEAELLRMACLEADLIKQLEDGMDGQPLMVSGSRGQQIVHPLIPEIRQHRTALAALLRQLKLPDDASVSTNQQRAAAQSRWAAAHRRSVN